MDENQLRENQLEDEPEHGKCKCIATASYLQDENIELRETITRLHKIIRVYQLELYQVYSQRLD